MRLMRMNPGATNTFLSPPSVNFKKTNSLYSDNFKALSLAKNWLEGNDLWLLRMKTNCQSWRDSLLSKPPPWPNMSMFSLKIQLSYLALKATQAALETSECPLPWIQGCRNQVMQWTTLTLKKLSAKASVIPKQSQPRITKFPNACGL